MGDNLHDAVGSVVTAEPPEWLTVAEVGELLRLDRSTAYRLARRLGTRPTPRAIRISRQRLDAFLAAGGVTR
jgi:excisionase family DNA binding protein